ncbi:Zinc phosphodiesterase ELAC protein 2 [Auxenochlorella protothecoides]|uniref:ribonuclease Z n=1 Tax=Auxenochlorella protothecoides TaxID=3075 RepID=A0A087SKN1_AUXPR|nr:Zinc phosphodiesterase ELAC protein 2 [Auxenochlorella protothecoides]KFM26285.1 Zinc phosphodiesterase ELAC protein 2 [Auxenochlorella protothecoides]
MRLRGDGVGQVHVTGPAGTVRDVAALQHFVQWKTPHVLASDCYPDGDSIVFEVVSAGRAYVQTPADRISLYVAIEDVIGLGRKAPPPPVAPCPPSPLALLTWVKSLDRLVLIARLANRVELEALQAHPAMPGLLGLTNGARLAACSVVLGEGLPASDPGLVDLAAALPCPMLLLPEPQEGLQAGNTAAARVSARLNLAAPAFFPLPHGLAVDGTVEACSTPGLCTGEPLTVTSSLALEFRAGEARTPSLTRLGVGHATPGEARAAALEAHPAAAGMIGVLHQAQPEVQAQGYDIPRTKADLPSLHFLGTGSAEPSKYRSASAIWLSLDPSSSILLDCGEGTAGQLTRTLGAVAARTLLATLRVLWVSHRHADHMGGVPGVLRAVPEGTPPPLVVGPRSLRDWLAACGGEDLRYEFLHAGCLRRPGEDFGVGLGGGYDAWSLRIDAARSWSIVYSGDTTPNPDLRALCSPPPTLLVHEATFGEGREGEAERKRHSTTAQALELAQIARPWATILTHFSQRYPGYPEGVPLDGNSPAVAAAFDGMVVSLRLLHALAATQPVVAVLLDRDEDEVVDVEGGQEP